MLRGRVDPKKEEQERLQGLLLDMLKEEENKYCADCQAKTPRWAAWNLGVFICIRCAGIHRNLGVHISKVRSVNLDSWSAEQVQTMRVMGNEKARHVYEHDLPAQFRRPTSDSQMEQFIRSKYEQKRYMIRDFTYPRVDVTELTKSLSQLTNKKVGNPVVSISARNTSAQNGNETKKTTGTVYANDLLDFSAPPKNESKATVNTTNFFDDIAGLSIQDSTPQSTAVDDFDDFGSFVSASTPAPVENKPQQPSFGDFADFSSAPTHPAPASSSNLADLSALSADTSSQNIEKKKSNADILSLFGSSGSAATTAPIVAPGGFAGFGLQAAPNSIPQNSFAAFGNVPAPVQKMNNPPQNDLYGGLSGINFGGMSSQGFGGIQTNPTPMGQQSNNIFGGIDNSPKPKVPQSPTGSQGFNIPNKSNAFADLALGKVMKTNYGQSALNVSSETTKQVSPKPSTTTSTNTVSNDLFDMFSSNPPPVPVAINASSGLDDLLGM